MLIFLLFFLVCSLHKEYFPIRLNGIGRISINFCFGPFSIIESSGGDNSTSLCTCVLHFLCCTFMCYIFRVVLTAFQYLQRLLLISVWEIFVQTLKKTFFSELSNLGLIHYLVIFLCLFQNYLSVIKLNCMLLLFLLLLISNLSVLLGWFQNTPRLLPSLD